MSTEMPLALIFQALRDTYSPYSPAVDASLRWITEATHVCHSWREAALSTPSLWTNINPGASIPWAFEFARRSGNAPIRFFVRPSRSGIRHPKFYDCVKTLIQENRQRILELSLLEIDEKEVTHIRSALSGDVEPAALYPILEDLQLGSNCRGALSPFLLTNNTLRAPELKRMALTSCIPMDAGPFLNLKYFSIKLKPRDMVKRLYQALLQMPNLEKLYLWPEFGWTCYLWAGGSVSELPPAILPNLRFIEFRGWDVPLISTMLKAISPGPERSLHVSPEDYHGVEELLSMFSLVMSHATDTPIRRLLLSINPSSVLGLWVKAWRGDLEATYPDIAMASWLCSQQMFLSRREVEFDIFALLVGLLGKMNYKELEILDLDLAEMLTVSKWVQLFGSLPSLATIELSWGERELFGALVDGIEDTPTHFENTTASVPFQALKEIRLGRRSHLYREEDIDFMLKCLRKRSELGMGLQKLYFRIPDPDSDLELQVSVFKDMVEVEFEFDG